MALLVIEVKVQGSRTYKPNSVRGIAPAGRPFLWAAHHCAALATYPKVGRTGPARVRDRSRGLPPYLVLLRVGFAMPAALLSRRCALTAPFHPYLGVAAAAVCFLWHFPSIRLEPDIPDVIRHTALRSSDFPLLAPEDARSGRPVRLPTPQLYKNATPVPRSSGPRRRNSPGATQIAFSASLPSS